LDSLVTAIQRVWHTAEWGEWTRESKEDSAEVLHSGERGMWICEVLCSRPVSWQWAQSTEGKSAE